jgi:hypothetical protein
MDRFARMFEKNPLAWVIGGALVIALWGSYRRGGERTELCSVALAALEIRAGGPLDVNNLDLNRILRDHERLLREESTAGDLYRWQEINRARIERICN